MSRSAPYRNPTLEAYARAERAMDDTQEISEDDDTEKARQGRKLAKMQDRVEHLEEIIQEQNEQIGELREENQRLETEVERLREMCEQAEAYIRSWKTDDGKDICADDLGWAARGEWEKLNVSLDALAAAEDGVDE